MKKLILLLTFSLLLTDLFAQSENTVLPGKGDTLLNNYLTSSMHKLYAERRVKLNRALLSTKSLKGYQKNCRKRYKGLFYDSSNMIGNVIPRVDSVGSIACDSYHIVKLILNGEITTNLYLPNAKGKKPAILFFCGHEMTSKATESYQKTAILLSQHGFIVLVIDPTGQGERVQLTDSTGKGMTQGATTEHTLLNMGAGLVGNSVIREELNDNRLCLNYICSRKDVDSTKIGCMGNSGGGAQCSYFSALDSRIKAAACCSWFTKRERMFALNGPDDGCQFLWNEGKEGLEIADYYIMQAPRPTLILAGKKDFIDYQGSLDAFSELKLVYDKLGKGGNVEFFDYNDGHGISQPKREVAVRFFSRCFMNDSSSIKEGDIKILPEKALQCTRSGQIRTDFPKKDGLQTRSLKMADYYELSRRGFERGNLDSNRVEMRSLLNMPDKLGAVSAKPIGKEDVQTLYSEKKLILSRDGEPDMPIRIFTPKTGLKPKSEVFVLLNDSGMVESMKLPVIKKILQNGNVIVFADPRGIGETKDRRDKNNKKYDSEDYRNAGLALFIGRPLLTERIIDVFTVLDFISADGSLKGKPIDCFAYGNIAVAAMHAAYLDNRINHVATSDCVLSWQQILQQPMEKNRMGLMMPNVLMNYDLPNIKDLSRRH